MLTLKKQEWVHHYSHYGVQSVTKKAIQNTANIIGLYSLQALRLEIFEMKYRSLSYRLMGGERYIQYPKNKYNGLFI